ncbi:MAG: MbtH family NRPS accessory protein [Zoogloeaceae bacterium]|jgi:MbtH protein|nr:MbtH family NRPS accessory protein [Zoogloeaceae bacterium]
MTTSCFDRDDEKFIVLINHEGQRSIWPHWKAVPGGWEVVQGIKGDKKTVLDYIDKAWTDMRPYSLRIAMGDTVDKEKDKVADVSIVGTSNVVPIGA